ncbi:ATP-grasp domain-containing protein [Aminithiophilus ramosus]|uniref:ATP-grasp domain-containing protein n=1 Tax=Aminithiophilus ramosus TaxID=3029084 RepID=A0A9Q7AQR8_9BACT|nr:ATP-grasp domain-containing protein [Aminithiophilus ramosus]
MEETNQDVPLVPLKIGIVYNGRREAEPEEPDDLYEEYDCEKTIEALAAEIARQGHSVVTMEQDDDLSRRLREADPDLVFNLAEGLGNGRGRESQVACLLESMDIPFTGSDSVSLSLTLDKVLTHTLLGNASLPTPEFHLFRDESDLKTKAPLFGEGATWIVKPRWEGSSKGIFPDSLVGDVTALEDRVRRIWSRYRQPALVERFLPGEEMTVGIVGTPPRLAGMMRIVAADDDGKPFLYSLEQKRDWVKQVRYRGPETIAPDLRSLLADRALRAFRALELRDVARIDFRLDGKGDPHIIDVNPLPGMSPFYSDLPILVRLSGGSYAGLVRAVIDAASLRHKLGDAVSARR